MSNDSILLLLGWFLAAIAIILAAWALLWDRSRGRRRCPRCWYDMKGVPGLRCPECGCEARSELRLLRTRRRWRAVAFAAILLVGAAILGTTPRWRKDGYAGPIPTVLLEPIMPLFGESADDALVAAIAPSAAPAPLGSFLPAARIGRMPPLLPTTKWGRLLLAEGISRSIKKKTAAGAIAPLDLSREMDLLQQIPSESGPAHAALLAVALHAAPDEAIRATRLLLLRTSPSRGAKYWARLAGPRAPRWTRIAAIAVADEFAPSLTYPVLRAGLDDPEERVRSMAAMALGSLGAHAQEALPRLRELAAAADKPQSGASWAIPMIESDLKRRSGRQGS